MTNDPRKTRMIIGHRGALSNAPENTMPSFRSALENGADGIEFDIQLTSDKVPVIYHDRTMHKINGARRRLSEYSLKELQKMDFGGWHSPEYEGEQIVTLEQLLKKYAGKTKLLVEIKSRLWDRALGNTKGLVFRVMALLGEYVPKKKQKDLYILSFDPYVLNLAHEIRPEWQYIRNVDKPEHVHDRLPRWVCGAGINIRKATREFTEYIHRSQRLLMVYPCNNMKELKRVEGLGTNIIITDKPQALH